MWLVVKFLPLMLNSIDVKAGRTRNYFLTKTKLLMPSKLQTYDRQLWRVGPKVIEVCDRESLFEEMKDECKTDFTS